MEETIIQDNDKVAKQFDENIAKLIALFKGDRHFRAPKVDTDEISSVIEELIADRKKAIVEEFKVKASNLLTAKMEFDKFVKTKEREFQDAVKNKKREFNTQIEDCFKLLSSIDEIRKSYEESLKA